MNIFDVLIVRRTSDQSFNHAAPCSDRAWRFSGPAVVGNCPAGAQQGQVAARGLLFARAVSAFAKLARKDLLYR